MRSSSKTTSLLACMATAVIVTLAAGCADLGMKPDLAADEAVRQRAQLWADNLLVDDIEGAWALTSPSYRQFTTWKQYYPHVQGSGRWTSATVGTVQCTEDVCEVSVMVEYEVKQMQMTNKRALDYKWIEVDGDWWLHVPAR